MTMHRPFLLVLALLITGCSAPPASHSDAVLAAYTQGIIDGVLATKTGKAVVVGSFAGR